MMREKQLYDVIVPMTKDNLPVFQMNIQYIRKNLDCKRVIVIGAEGLREDSLINTYLILHNAFPASSKLMYQV